MKTNVLILAARAIHDERDSGYPLCLSEIGGKPIIQRQVEQCAALGNFTLTVALQDEDCKQWSLDNVVRQLSPEANILRIRKPTAGAACTALLAIGQINTSDPLLILNSDEQLALDFAKPVSYFRDGGFDGGVIVFPSVHPRYSFVRLSENGDIVEAAEKNPISQHATAGFYWFREGRLFVEAAQATMLKRAHVNGHYYVCPTLNEMILRQAKLTAWRTDGSSFHPLKSERQIERLNL